MRVLRVLDVTSPAQVRLFNYSSQIWTKIGPCQVYTFNQAKNYGTFETRPNSTENARKIYEHMGIKNYK